MRNLTPCSLRPMQIYPTQLPPNEAHIAIILQWSSPIRSRSKERRDPKVSSKPPATHIRMQSIGPPADEMDHAKNIQKRMGTGPGDCWQGGLSLKWCYISRLALGWNEDLVMCFMVLVSRSFISEYVRRAQ